MGKEGEWIGGEDLKVVLEAVLVPWFQHHLSQYQQHWQLQGAGQEGKAGLNFHFRYDLQPTEEGVKETLPM